MMRKILLIYTGGTIGMKMDAETMSLRPFDFSQIISEVPELKKFGYQIDTYSFSPLIDSSDADVPFWIDIAEVIEKNYAQYDGFVVLHGTDTMSYTASALSFMLENLEKPVIFTGSQLPIGVIRTDGKENLISSIEIAATAREDGRPMVPEVCIFFDNLLFRGNRTTKFNAENFMAFRSANLPPLAEAGVHLKFDRSVIRYPYQWGKPLSVNTGMDTSVAVLKLVPGLNFKVLDSILSMSGLRALILETFGSGNAPSSEPFLNFVRSMVERGVLLYNVTQCQRGSVDMRAYATGRELERAGVISGRDITFEAAIAKLYYLMGKYADNGAVARELESDMRGEITFIS